MISSDGSAQLCEMLCKILYYALVYGLTAVQMWQPGNPYSIDYGNSWVNRLLEEDFLLMN